MVNGSPGDRPDWVLSGELAQSLAPPLDAQTQNDYPLTLAGLMQITHRSIPLGKYTVSFRSDDTCPQKVQAQLCKDQPESS